MPCDLFYELNQHFMETSKGINTHCFILIKIICSEFIKLRRFYTIKLTDLYLAGDSIIHKLNKTVLFSISKAVIDGTSMVGASCALRLPNPSYK